MALQLPRLLVVASLETQRQHPRPPAPQTNQTQPRREIKDLRLAQRRLHIPRHPPRRIRQPRPRYLLGMEQHPKPTPPQLNLEPLPRRIPREIPHALGPKLTLLNPVPDLKVSNSHPRRRQVRKPLHHRPRDVRRLLRLPIRRVGSRRLGPGEILHLFSSGIDAYRQRPLLSKEGGWTDTARTQHVRRGERVAGAVSEEPQGHQRQGV